jgi:hypothetical protein
MNATNNYLFKYITLQNSVLLRKSGVTTTYAMHVSIINQLVI